MGADGDSGGAKRRAPASPSARPGGRQPVRKPSRAPARRDTSRPSTAARPATAARGRAAPVEEQAPDQRAQRAWVRGVVLVSILVILAVMLAPTARSLLRQRGEISALQEQVAQQQVSVADLTRERARWDDPAYVEQQARERLKFVKVGDRSYSVIDPSAAGPKLPSSAVVAAPSASADAPWYGRLWESVKLADRPTAGMAPVP